MMPRAARANTLADDAGWAEVMGELFTTHGVARWALFFAGWVALGRVQATDLVAGLVISAFAARISLRLLAPSPGRLRPSGILAYGARFMAGSLNAGWDVARRVAVTPPAVRPGILKVPCAVPEGIGRDAFRALASLQPGTLPMAAPGPDLDVHCLDVAAPVAAMLAEDARAFLAMADRPRHG